MALNWQPTRYGTKDDRIADLPDGTRLTIRRSSWGAEGICWFLYRDGAMVDVKDTRDDAMARAEKEAQPL